MYKVFLRFLAGLLLPVYLGTTIICGVSLVQEAKGNVNLLELPFALVGGVLFFPFGALFVGAQSVIYSFLMEFVVNPFVKSHVLAVSISVCLGMLSVVVLGTDRIVLVGALVGLLVGIFLRSIYSFESNPDE
ncbi:MAG: hypothetical protein P8166_11150 [Candidatus Thiodiazotropha sp.]|jgi:hypothetical protein